jgi:hypothetical protein
MNTVSHTIFPAMNASNAANAANAANGEDFAPMPQRLIWLIELMSRYAREFAQSHESPRLAAAILSHLKSLANELPATDRLAETTEHWIDVWEPILDQHIKPGAAMPQPLRTLIDRARAF